MHPPTHPLTSSLPLPLPVSADVDSTSCRLLGPVALVVQLIMGLLVVGSLVYKRQKERPKRKWKVWLLDVCKQLLGQLFVHTLNLVFSQLGFQGEAPQPQANPLVSHAGRRGNPCGLYFLNILVDTTLGVFIIYLLLRYLTSLLTTTFQLQGFVSGQYTPSPSPSSSSPSSPSSRSSTISSSISSSITRRRRGAPPRPKLSYWLKQLALYLFVLLIMKLCVLLLLYAFPVLVDLGNAILDLFGTHKDAQVVFSLAAFPLAMNVVQFWLIDSLLRHNPSTSKYAQLPTERPSTDLSTPSPHHHQYNDRNHDEYEEEADEEERMGEREEQQQQAEEEGGKGRTSHRYPPASPKVGEGGSNGGAGAGAEDGNAEDGRGERNPE
ncbi:hypothetical protein ACQY0O_006611 [Thecaphora frezii]